jgi:2C-methyl-D-erythritol 2,4-cyclodiphosphate synthase
MASTILSLLLILANDIERNPGPPQNAAQFKQNKLENLVNELQREVKQLKKVVEQQSAQIDAQIVREKPKMATLFEEMSTIKDMTSIQVYII